MQVRRLAPWIGALLLFSATFFVYRVHYDPRLNGSGYETVALANSLVHHHSFADPFMAMPTGPSAHLAPGFPYLVAWVVRFVPSGPMVTFILSWIAVIVIAIQLTLLPWFTTRMDLGPWPGLIAGVLWLVGRITIFERWETQFASLFFLLLAVGMYRISSRQARTAEMVAVGAFWGFVLLWNTSAGVVLVAWLVYLLLRRAASVKQVAILGLLALLVVSPWIARNFVVFHRLVLVRDNLGLELQISNNPCSSYAFEMNRFTGCFYLFHPNFNKFEANDVRRLGEVDYNHAKLKTAERWIAANPQTFLTLTMKRIGAFWMPSIVQFAWEDGRIPLERYLVTLLSALSVPGLVLLWHRQRILAEMFFLWLVFFPPAYYVVQYYDRYRFPILWATFLPASYFLMECLERLRVVRRTESVAVPTSASA